MKIKNLMKLPFVACYVCDEDGTVTQVPRKDFFVFPIDPDQRWFWHFDDNDPISPNNIIVRMPLTAQGKKIGNASGAEHKYDIRNSDEDVVSLDSLIEADNGKANQKELTDPSDDPCESFVKKDRTEKIRKTLRRLLTDDWYQLAIDVLVYKKTERELAPKYGCSPKTIGNHKRKIVEILAADEVLKELWKEI
jgi:hypothetical protein